MACDDEGAKGEYLRIHTSAVVAELHRLSAEASALPADSAGVVTSPRYLPKGHALLAKWRAYCKETPPEKWPSWLRVDVAVMKRSAK